MNQKNLFFNTPSRPQTNSEAMLISEPPAAPEEQVGFQQVIARLQACNKLVITHNGLLDILLTVEHFVAPLPGTIIFPPVLVNLFAFCCAELLSDAKVLLRETFPKFELNRSMASTHFCLLGCKVSFFWAGLSTRS